MSGHVFADGCDTQHHAYIDIVRTAAADAKTWRTLSPLGTTRYKVQLTASQQLHDKLRRAQDLLRHELPSGDLAPVIERAVDLLIADRMKRRFGQVSKPRERRNSVAAPRKSDSRHIPHDVRRKVFARDGARCTFFSADGKRCEQRGGLELHHEQPFGKGGQPTVDNIRVVCRAHNQLLAERDYGRAYVQQRVRDAREERRGKQGSRATNDAFDQRIGALLPASMPPADSQSADNTWSQREQNDANSA